MLFALNQYLSSHFAEQGLVHSVIRLPQATSPLLRSSDPFLFFCVFYFILSWYSRGRVCTFYTPAFINQLVMHRGCHPSEMKSSKVSQCENKLVHYLIHSLICQMVAVEVGCVYRGKYYSLAHVQGAVYAHARWQIIIKFICLPARREQLDPLVFYASSPRWKHSFIKRFIMKLVHFFCCVSVCT